MNKTIKLFGLLFVMFTCMVFYGYGVKADGCSCYYKYTGDDYSYSVNIKLDTNSADIKNWSYHSGSETTNDWFERGDPFRINPGPIISQERDSAGYASCSLSACNSVEVYADFDRNSKKGKLYVCDNNCDGSICNKCSDDEANAIKSKQKLQVTDAKGALVDFGSAVVESSTVDNNSTDDLAKIKAWGESEKYDVSDLGNDCNVISGDIKDFLNNLIWILSIIGIILLVVMTALEFAKVVTGQDDEGIKKAFKHTIIRIICVIILLLLPMIVSGVVTIINNNAGATVQIGDSGSPTCQIGE